MAGEWTRETRWRQGSAIELGASLSLGLLKPEDGHSRIVLVVSHDCDIAEDNLDNEPNVEVIIGRIISQADPNLTHAKSPNRLHLDVIRDGGSAVIELRATEKHQLLKSVLAPFEPDPSITLDSRSRETLQAWLSSRYRRAAFPDALNQHLAPLRETLQKIGKQNPNAVIGFYIYFEPDLELKSLEEPYEVWIVVVFDHFVQDAEQYAQEATARITTRMEAKFRTNTGWRGVELRGCDACADDEFSLYQAMTFKAFPLEYLSLRKAEAKS